MSEINDEWSLLSNSYEDVLLRRFEPLYNCIGNLVVNYIKLNETQGKYKLLDYGTGPGEPILTILKILKENQLLNVEYEGTDSSVGMISLAKQRFNKLNLNNINIDFNSSNNLSNLNLYDIIMNSLVLQYLSNKRELLELIHKHLNHNGILMSSYWPHPSRVPFLSLLKRINVFMSNGQQSSVYDLESNISFSCSNEEKTIV